MMHLPILGADPPIAPPKRYAVHSMFRTIQGEGFHAGKLAVFIRFSGCNVWTGREEDRERDAKKGSCARFCDTEFFGVDEKNGGGRFTAHEIVKRVYELWGHAGQVFVVFTGGEPSLQVDVELIEAFRENMLCFLAMETNGSKELGSLYIDWTTLSPKPPMHVNANNYYDEVKVLYPEYNPMDYLGYASHKFIQPVDPPKTGPYIDIARENMRKCVEFVHNNPSWRISVQQHKVLGIP